MSQTEEFSLFFQYKSGNKETMSREQLYKMIDTLLEMVENNNCDDEQHEPMEWNDLD